MNRLDEAKIIRIFQQSFGKKSKFVPEDVEVLSFGKTNFVTKSDMLVESTDVPSGMKIEQIARKSVVACASDFASKGVRPLYATVSLAIPRRFSKSQIKKLAHGFMKASKEFDVKIVGGDLNEGKELVIEVSMFGIVKNIISRRGAKINDIIITSGPFGYASAGLKIILNQSKADSKFIKKCKQKVFFPTPNLKFGLAIANYVSSSMDSSDGLSTTLKEMSKQSGKRFVITKIPSYPDVEKFAKANRVRFIDLVFHGGEEYEIVATVSQKNITKIRQIARKQKMKLFEIGHVSKGKDVIYLKGNKIITIPNKGWLHFKS